MSPALRQYLIAQLQAAVQAFSHGQTAAGLRDLRLYVAKLTASEDNDIKADLAGRLIGQANVIIGCSPLRNSGPEVNSNERPSLSGQQSVRARQEQRQKRVAE